MTAAEMHKELEGEKWAELAISPLGNGLVYDPAHVSHTEQFQVREFLHRLGWRFGGISFWYFFPDYHQ